MHLKLLKVEVAFLFCHRKVNIPYILFFIFSESYIFVFVSMDITSASLNT